MKRVFFHIEVEDCYWEEAENPTLQGAADLERQTIKYMSELFGAPVSVDGTRECAIEGIVRCSFKTDSLDRVRRIIRDNLLTEGNDQIISGAEYVIVRDFQI